MTTVATDWSTQTDPLQADVGSPYPSSYIYGNNNPNVYVDPTGMRGAIVGATNPLFLGFSGGRPEIVMASSTYGHGDAYFHNIAVKSIDLAAQALSRSDPTMDIFVSELAIPGGSKNGTGFAGSVDLAAKRRNGDYELAEVKPNKASYLASGAAEVLAYSSALTAAFKAGRIPGKVRPAGYGSPWPTAGSAPAPCGLGICVVVWVHIAPSVYGWTVSKPQAKPLPVPVPVPDPVPSRDPIRFRIPRVD